jgi:predicted nucleotidyltransferase
MSLISDDMRLMIELLQKHNVEFAVCGGHAVAFHGYPRLTMDIDLLVNPTPENAGRMVKVLEEFGFDRAGIPRDAFLAEGTAVTLGVQPNQVDLLTSISKDSTSDVVRRSVEGSLADIQVKFVSLNDLVRAKREAARPKDLADLDELEKFQRKE